MELTVGYILLKVRIPMLIICGRLYAIVQVTVHFRVTDTGLWYA